MEDSRTYLPRDYRKNIPILGSKIKKIFGDDTLLICPLMRGGCRDFDTYKKYLKQTNCIFPDYIRFDIDTKDEVIDGEYTKFTASIEEIQKTIEESGKSVKHMIIFDNVSRTGTTILGGVAFGLEHRDELGIDKVYTMTSYDLIGIVDFSVFKGYDEWIGLIEFMKKGYPLDGISARPIIYKKLKKAGLLKHIGSVDIENHFIQKKLRNVSDEDVDVLLKLCFKNLIGYKD